MQDRRSFVIGTAGHIDHGKSSLVLALTGTNPDRLPEERTRGMTIDLGFAHLALDELDLSFVDVPGHERFVHNMLAGASGIDLALFVVAADDAVMPQTREHAEILSLLGVDRCVVAITKIDLVDDAWADEVATEVRALLDAHAIQIDNVIRTSALTGRGLAELRSALAAAARTQTSRAVAPAWFCMPVDRAFAVPGRGVVVTGTVSHGAVRVGDELAHLPGGLAVRVRDLQSHHDAHATAAGRRRLAINLTGVERDACSRGNVLATPGHLAPALACEVLLTRLRLPGRLPRRTLLARLHAAALECSVRVLLTASAAESQLVNVFAQLRSDTPLHLAWGQRFVLRDASGARTLGGGRVLRPVARPWRAKRGPHLDGLAALAGDDPLQRLDEVVRDAEWVVPAAEQLAVRAGLPDAASVAPLLGRLQGAGRVRRLGATGGSAHVHAATLASLAADLHRRLMAYFQANPRAPGVPKVEWPSWMPAACPPRLRPLVASWLLESSAFDVQSEHVRPADERPKLSRADDALLTAVIDELARAGLQPPAPPALAAATTKNAARIVELLRLAAADGRVVRVDDDIWLHGDAWRRLVATTVATIRERGSITVSDLRTVLGSSRKYVVPFAEALDRAGLTRRVGDARVLGPAAAEPASSTSPAAPDQPEN